MIRTRKHISSASCVAVFLAGITSIHAETQPKFAFTPLTPTALHLPSYGYATVQYQVTNMTKINRTLVLVPTNGVTQNTGNGYCPSPFYLPSKSHCILSLTIDRHILSTNGIPDGPQVCKTNGSNNAPDPFLCSKPSQSDVLSLKQLSLNTTDTAFPYGSAPQGNVCVDTDYYATPETMLGSWAMIEAVAMDTANGSISNLFTPNNVVYAVGTAAIGDQLGMTGCSTGCNELNGYCFAIKFNTKTSYPYMIFQSVNIGANPNSFDIYMAGGGSGAFPAPCGQFWGTDTTVNWQNNIENAASCDAYFNNYSTINSKYSVTYNGVAHPAKETLMNACTFASSAVTGFNTANWSQLSVVPVTCPKTLTQITGVELPSDITTIGDKQIYDIKTFQASYFTASTIAGVTTTQMQDCKTPSSGYCNNVTQSVPNYQASISASLTTPLLTGQPPPSTNYCTQNPTYAGGFCSWNKGQSSGGAYCDQSEQICFSCGNSPSWCLCNNGELVSCTS